MRMMMFNMPRDDGRNPFRTFGDMLAEPQTFTFSMLRCSMRSIKNALRPIAPVLDSTLDRGELIRLLRKVHLLRRYHFWSRVQSHH